MMNQQRVEKHFEMFQTVMCNTLQSNSMAELTSWRQRSNMKESNMRFNWKWASLAVHFHKVLSFYCPRSLIRFFSGLVEELWARWDEFNPILRGEWKARSDLVDRVPASLWYFFNDVYICQEDEIEGPYFNWTMQQLCFMQDCCIHWE